MDHATLIGIFDRVARVSDQRFSSGDDRDRTGNLLVATRLDTFGMVSSYSMRPRRSLKNWPSASNR
jgi:hypothetical protein